MKILFVCTGNTCRSPMAAALLKDMLKEKGIFNIKVESAGIAASPDQKANPLSSQVMEEQGIQITDHRTRQIQADQLKQANLILTMTEGHKTAVLSGEPSVWNNIFTLNEYAEMEEKDIPDPYGLSKQEYQITAHKIRSALEKVIDKLKDSKS